MNKKRKYAYTAMTSASLMIVAIIIVNIIFSVLSDKIALKIDLTKDNILTFSETTENVLKELEDEVNIISLIPQSDNSREMLQLDEVLKKYERSSSKISYSRVDTKRNPAVLNKYQRDGKALDSDYNVVFESEKMYTVVDVNDLIMMYKDNQTNQVLSGALSAEQYFSSAIVKVTKGSNIKALVATGHGEVFNAENFKTNILPGSGYDFKDVSLSTGTIDEDTNLLILSSPETDYSADEIEKIDSFSKKGGDIIILADSVNVELPNLSAYMSEWGVKFENGMAADDDVNNFARYKTFILGQIQKNEITDSMGINGQQVVFPLARPVVCEEKVGITFASLASTGENGFVKTNVYSSDDSFEEGDIRKKSDLAVMLRKQIDVETDSKMFVMGTSLFLGDYGDEVNAFTNILSESGNRKFVSGLFTYMTDQPSSFYIMPKNIVQDKVVISQFSIYIYTMITVIILPIAILAWGLITWLRRRHS